MASISLSVNEANDRGKRTGRAQQLRATTVQLDSYDVCEAVIMPSGFVRYTGIRPGAVRSTVEFDDGSLEVDRITVALSAPGPLVENVSASRDSLFVQWRPPPDTDGVTGITARLKPDGVADWTQTVTLAPWATGHLFSDLNVLTNYDVEVFATNPTGRGPTDIQQFMTLAPPPPPNAPTVTHSETADGIVVMLAPAAGPRANAWQVQYRRSPDRGWLNSGPFPASQLSYVIPGSFDGGTYQFQARGQNSDGVGPWSPVASRTVIQTIPGKPTIAGARASDGNSFVVSFTPQGSAVPTGWEVQVSGYGERPDDRRIFLPGSARTFNVGRNQARHARIRGFTGAGNGDWSDEVSVYSNPRSSNDLSRRPENLQVSSNWIRPTKIAVGYGRYIGLYIRTDRGDGNIYGTPEIQWRAGTSGAWTTDPRVIPYADGGTDGTGAIVFDGLTPSTTYQFRYRSRNRQTGFYTGWSNAVQVTTPANRSGVPNAPSIGAIERINPTKIKSRRTLGVSWSAPSSGGFPTSWRVEYRRQNPVGSWVGVDIPGEFTSSLLEEIDATYSGGYDVRVRGVNSSGNGAWRQAGWSYNTRGNLRNKEMLPPQNVTGRGGSTSITMDWTPNPDTVFARVSGYNAVATSLWVTDRGITGGTTRVGNADSSATITGLAVNTGYYCTVAADSTNLGIDDEYADWIYVTTGAAAAPGQPTIRISSVMENRATLTWAAPAGSDPITAWTLQWRRGSTGSWTTINIASGSTLTRDLTGLSSGQLHNARVRATTAGGPGLWSSIASFTTSSVVRVRPGTPGTPRFSQSGRNLTVTWTASTGDPTRYETWWEIDFGPPDGWVNRRLGGGTTALSDTWRNIAVTGTMYRVRVRASNAAGNSSWTGWTTYTAT